LRRKRILFPPERINYLFPERKRPGPAPRQEEKEEVR